MRLEPVCPKCGASIIQTMICTNPPIPTAKCTECDWYWEGEKEEVVRVPFNPNGYGVATIEVPRGSYDLTIPMFTTVHINT